MRKTIIWSNQVWPSKRKLRVEDLHAIASINRIIRNYRMMKKLLGA